MKHDVQMLDFQEIIQQNIWNMLCKYDMFNKFLTNMYEIWCLNVRKHMKYVVLMLDVHEILSFA